MVLTIPLLCPCSIAAASSLVFFYQWKSLFLSLLLSSTISPLIFSFCWQSTRLFIKERSNERFWEETRLWNVPTEIMSFTLLVRPLSARHHVTKAPFLTSLGIIVGTSMTHVLFHIQWSTKSHTMSSSVLTDDECVAPWFPFVGLARCHRRRRFSLLNGMAPPSLNTDPHESFTNSFWRSNEVPRQSSRTVTAFYSLQVIWNVVIRWCAILLAVHATRLEIRTTDLLTWRLSRFTPYYYDPKRAHPIKLQISVLSYIHTSVHSQSSK